MENQEQSSQISTPVSRNGEPMKQMSSSVKRILKVLFFVTDIAIFSFFLYTLGSSLLWGINQAYNGFPHLFPSFGPLIFSAIIIGYLYLRIRSVFVSRLERKGFMISSLINISIILLFVFISGTLLSGSNLGLGGLVLGGLISFGTLIVLAVSVIVFVIVFFTSYKRKPKYILDALVVIILFILIVLGARPISSLIYTGIETKHSQVQLGIRQVNEENWPRENINMHKVLSSPEYIEALYDPTLNRLPYDYCCIEKPNGDIVSILDFQSPVSINRFLFINDEEIMPNNSNPFDTGSIKVTTDGKHLSYNDCTGRCFISLDGEPIVYTDNYGDSNYRRLGFFGDDFCFSSSGKSLFYREPLFTNPNIVEVNTSTLEKVLVPGELQNYCDFENDGMSGGEHKLERISLDEKTWVVSANGKQGPWFDYVWPPHIDDNQIIYGAVLGDEILLVKQKLSDFGVEISDESVVEDEPSAESMIPDDWEIYTDIQNQFEFKHPTSWRVSKELSLSTRTLVNFGQAFEITYGIYYNQDLGRAMTIEEFLLDENEYVISLGGKQAFREGSAVYVPLNDGSILTISKKDLDENTFLKILSTFKFID